MLKPETYKKYADILRNQPARELDAMPGRRRISEYADTPVNKPELTLAQKIVATAERARTPGGFDPPVTKDPLALAILRAGKMRRGEPV